MAGDVDRALRLNAARDAVILAAKAYVNAAAKAGFGLSAGWSGVQAKIETTQALAIAVDALELLEERATSPASIRYLERCTCVPWPPEGPSRDCPVHGDGG
jgi:hypothetical protein